MYYPGSERVEACARTFEELADVYQLASAGSVMRRYRKAIKKLQGFLFEKQNGETENWDL